MQASALGSQWLTIPAGGQSLLPDATFEDDLLFAGDGNGTATRTVTSPTIEGVGTVAGVRLETTQAQSQPYGVQLAIDLAEDVAAGDAVLVTFFARGSQADGSDTDTQLLLQQSQSPYASFSYQQLRASAEWRQFAFPVQMPQAAAAGTAAMVLHAGNAVQTLEIAGLRVLNYADAQTRDTLPLTGPVGHADTWKVDADARIDAHRKANLTVNVRDAEGNPVEGASVQVTQTGHAFDFGTAVSARWLGITQAEFDALPASSYPAGMTWDDVLAYRQIVRTRFNKAVFENDLGWQTWEVAQSNTSATHRLEWIERASDWLAAEGIEVRGHYGSWGAIEPNDWAHNYDTSAGLDQRIVDHIAAKVPAVGTRVTEWDAINHPVGWTSDTVEGRYGSQFEADIFTQFRQLAPHAELWVNEDQTLPSGSRADAYAAYVSRLLGNGAPVDGIGFQAHFDESNDRRMQDVVAELDRFAALVPNLQLTELDVDSSNDAFVARTLADTLRAAFSQPDVGGVMQWGFWESRHWRPDAALYNADFSPTAAGQAYLDQVFGEWWTDETSASDAAGTAAVRGFKGDYEVTVTYGGETVTLPATLGDDGLTLDVDLSFSGGDWQTIPDGGVLMTAAEPLDDAFIVGSQHVTRTVFDVNDASVPFETAVRVVVNEAQPNPWDIQLIADTFGDAEAGDVLLISFFARGFSGNESGTTAATSYFQHGGAPYTKYASAPIRTGPEWTQYLVPFEMPVDELDGEHLANVFMGDLEQTIEIGRFQLWNFNQLYTVDELPKTKVTYPGQAPDAPWRAEADARIDQYRKADAEVLVVDENGNPIEGAVVRLQQQSHEFQFGVAVKAKWLGITQAEFDALPAYAKPDGMVWDDVLTYRQVLEDNYNKIVLENDLKWSGWETSLSDDQNSFRISWTDRSLQWAADRGIEVRGHYGAWGTIDGDNDWNQGGDTSAGLDQRLTDHIAAKIPSLEGRVEEWDAINHPIGWTGETLESRYGSDFDAGIFQQMRALNPDAQLWVNEGQLLSGGGRQDAYEAYINRMLDRGAPVDGIGFMGHFDDGSLVGMDALYNRLERFAAVVPNLMVTEYDYLTDDAELAADYMRDFMTVAFSHPAMDSFMQWGFWEDAFFEPGRALWSSDWTINPNGQAYVNQTQNVWWTDETAATAADGLFTTRGFKGEYVLTVEVNGQVQTIPVNLSEGGLSETVTFVVDAGEAPEVSRVNSTVRYVENRGPNYFARSARITDADTTDYGGTVLRVAVPGALPEDVLGLLTGDGVKPGVATFGSGSGVVTIARPGLGDVPLADAVYAGGSFTITFRDGASRSDVTRVLRRAAYRADGELLTPGRQIEVTLTDADGNTSPVQAGAVSTLNLVNVADNPVLTGVLEDVTFTEDGAAAAIAAGATVSDVDTSDWGGARLDVYVRTPREAEDRFLIDVSADAEATLDGSTLSLDGLAVATLLRGVSAPWQVVVFLPGTSAADVARVLRLVHFQTASDDPRGPKTVRVQLTDPDGGRGVVLAPLQIASVNDPPAILNVAGRTAAVVAGGAARVIASSFSIDDPDYRGGGGSLAVAIGGTGVGQSLTIAGSSTVSVVGSDVMYQGTVIGTVVGLGTPSMRVDFTAEASFAAVRSVGRRIALEANAASAAGPVDVTWVFTDEAGADSPPAVMTVDVSAGFSSLVAGVAPRTSRTTWLDDFMASAATA